MSTRADLGRAAHRRRSRAAPSSRLRCEEIFRSSYPAFSGIPAARHANIPPASWTALKQRAPQQSDGKDGSVGGQAVGFKSVTECELITSVDNRTRARDGEIAYRGPA